MSCHIFGDYVGGLCLLRNTSFNEQRIKWKEFKACVSSVFFHICFGKANILSLKP